MHKKLFTNFLELKEVIQGNKIGVRVSGVLIGTSYTLLKHSLRFDRFDYEIQYSKYAGLIIIHEINQILKDI